MLLLALLAGLTPPANAVPFSCGQLFAQLNELETRRSEYPRLDDYVKACERNPLGEFDTEDLKRPKQDKFAQWQAQTDQEHRSLERDETQPKACTELADPAALTTLDAYDQRLFSASQEYQQAVARGAGQIDRLMKDVADIKKRQAAALADSDVLAGGKTNPHDVFDWINKLDRFLELKLAYVVHAGGCIDESYERADARFCRSRVGRSSAACPSVKQRASTFRDHTLPQAGCYRDMLCMMEIASSLCFQPISMRVSDARVEADASQACKSSRALRAKRAAAESKR